MLGWPASICIALNSGEMESIMTKTNTNENVTVNKNDKLESKIMQLVTMKYDLQKLRIATGNRICASFDDQMGRKPGMSKEEMDDEAKKLLNQLKAEYKRITDAMIENKASVNQIIKSKEIELNWIKTKLDYDLVSEYISLLEVEKRNVASMKKLVHEHPLYNAFFTKPECCGIGEETAAACIAMFDIRKARHASSFWSYAGLNPVRRINKDGEEVIEGNSKKYTEKRTYIDKDGKEQTKMGITYNPKLKTMLLGVTASNIMKCCIRNEKDPVTKEILSTTVKGYAVQYMDYKHRKQNEHPEWSAAHINNVAKRWMIRNFVRDLWVAWRQVEGLPVTIPYEQEFLGKAPHKWPNVVVYPGQNNIQEEE